MNIITVIKHSRVYLEKKYIAFPSLKLDTVVITPHPQHSNVEELVRMIQGNVSSYMVDQSY